MLSAKDVAIVYETLLSSPGMNEAVKISLNVSRKQVLVLSKVLELGFSAKSENGNSGLLSAVDAATIEELRGISEEILKKAGLTETNEKLNGLQAK